MVGWILDIALFKSVVPGFVTMKFSTAFSFFLSSGIILVMTFPKKYTAFGQIIMPTLILIQLLSMTLLLSSNILDFDSQITKLFLVESQLDTVYTFAPGIPSIPTTVSFILIGMVGLFFLFDSSYTVMVFRIVAIGIALIAIIALLGYALDIPELYYYVDELSTGMAIHTAVLFFLLGVALLLSSRDSNRV